MRCDLVKLARKKETLTANWSSRYEASRYSEAYVVDTYDTADTASHVEFTSRIPYICPLQFCYTVR